jgi:membrane protease YdiL (CAAX protease family)
MSKDSSKPTADPLNLPDKVHPHLAANFGAPFLVILKTIAIFILSQGLAYILLVAGYAVWFQAKGQQASYEIIQNKLSSDFDHSVAIQFLSIFLAEGLIVLLVLLALKKRKLGLKAIGLGRLPTWQDVKKALLGFGTYYLFFIILASIVFVLLPDLNNNQQQDVGFTDLSTSTQKLIGIIGLVIIPPIAEEVLMRGYLYSGLRSRWKFLPSLIVTSLLFGAAHLLTGVGPGLLWVAGIQTFILSAVLVYMREKTSALYAGIMIHSFNNLIAFFVHFHG